MGVICTTNKHKRAKIVIDDADAYKNVKIENDNLQKTQNNLNIPTNNNKNSFIGLNLEEYKFYFETVDKNDYFIVSNYENLKCYSNVKKYYNKWEEILQFTRPQKKFSYRNLNQNPNFIICPTDKLMSKQENFLNKLNENDLNNKEVFNIRALGRGSQVINYVGKTLENSNLIQKFQIAFYFNKYRYIKYLSKGPPNNIRWTIWISLALCQSQNDFISEDKFIELINKNDSNFQTYEEDQIKKDLNRSNPNAEYFNNKAGLDSLYNVLKALAIEDPELGYCQGMNILAANFLLISDGNEFETFNLLRFLFKHLELREFFLNGFPKLIMYLFILKEFIKENMPKLFQKIIDLDVPEETWIFKWLQTLYNLTLPLSITIRLMDCVLCFGLEFLLNFSLSFIKFFEKKLLECQDINDFLKIFKNEEMINPSLINNNSYSNHTTELNNLNTNNITNLIMRNNNKDNENLNNISNLCDLKIQDFLILKKLSNQEKEKTIEKDKENPLKLNKIKSKKFEMSCFDFLGGDKDKNKQENNEKNSIKNSKENINYLNDNTNNNNDEKKSQNTTINHMKYLINSKDELIWFREKLITNSKKIDLKDAIKKMIEDYTKENIEIKNKFNQNDSSTGDGLNEEKSVFYENINLNKEEIKSPFETACMIENQNFIINKSDKENLVFNSLHNKSRKNSRKKSDEINNRESIYNIKEEDDDIESGKISPKNRSINKENIEKYHIEPKRNNFNKRKYCCECTNKKIIRLENMEENEDNCPDHNCKNHNVFLEKNIQNNNEFEVKEFYINEKEENERIKDDDLRMDLYMDDYKIENNINEHRDKCNDNVYAKVLFPETPKRENPQSSLTISKNVNDLRLTNIYDSPQKANYFKKNPYSCKNISNKCESYYESNQELTNLKSCKYNNFNNYNIRSFFSFNFNSNKNSNDFHRYSLDLNQNVHTNTARVLTVEQISMMNNIKDKLEIIKKIEILDIEENEDENNEQFNVDEDFDFDMEFENRSKIGRNINEGGNNLRKMSLVFSPENIKKFNSNNLNCNEDEIILDKSFNCDICSLYEDNLSDYDPLKFKIKNSKNLTSEESGSFDNNKKLNNSVNHKKINNMIICSPILKKNYNQNRVLFSNEENMNIDTYDSNNSNRKSPIFNHSHFDHNDNIDFRKILKKEKNNKNMIKLKLKKVIISHGEENNDNRDYNDKKFDNKIDKNNLEISKIFECKDKKGLLDMDNHILGNRKNKNETNFILCSIDDDRINTICDEYSTIDKRNLNTKNIKELDISGKFNIDKKGSID